VMLEWSPRFDYARAAAEIETDGAVAVARGGGGELRLDGLPDGARVESDADGKPVLRCALMLRAGERKALLCAWRDDAAGWRVDEWADALRSTTGAWREWVASRDEGQPCDFAGEWQPLVERSGLVLKLLTSPRHGGIAAAATTSLPEEIGGERNWDYRFSWIRDASFTAQALVALGHRDEAADFLHWAERVCMQNDVEGRLRLMYRLDGGTDISESELPHLDGYRNSQPVRIGNKAADQFQLDIYGELLGAAYELARLGESIDAKLWRFLSRVADKACSRWQKPDYGIWEVRSEPRHFVYSKLMVWVALDRALRLADRFGLEADRARWRHTRAAVHAEICERGWNEERGAFVQAYGSDALDAANLMMGPVGFLPIEDPRVQATIDRSLEELTENGLVFRYRTDATDDGLEGHEGAFGLTTFWMIDALALSGRLDEARAMFEGVARRANHVGLYAEEFDPGSGAFLGNFPQAFSHIGFINSAVYLAHAEGVDTPQPAPIGSAAERAERLGRVRAGREARDGAA
jgi:GH15 family glucan-1,4-alpha-glucosidase